MVTRRTPFQRLRGASAGSTPAAEIRFWALVLALLAWGVYGWYAPEFEARVGLPVIPGDGSVRPNEILAALSAYGAAGRHSYVAFLSLACLLPVAGSLLLLRLYEALVDPRQFGARALRRLTVVAVLPALFELVEHTLHALLAMLYPRWAALLASIAYAVTVGKLLAVAAALITLGTLVVLWLRRRVDARLRQREPNIERPGPHETS